MQTISLSDELQQFFTNQHNQKKENLLIQPGFGHSQGRGLCELFAHQVHFLSEPFILKLEFTEASSSGAASTPWQRSAFVLLNQETNLVLQVRNSVFMRTKDMFLSFDFFVRTKEGFFCHSVK